MVPLMSLWLPILLSAVFVFIASSIIHMMFSYHHKDFKRAPEEDKLMNALRAFNIPPGEYLMPHAGSPKVFNTPEHQEKLKKGPGAILTIWDSGNQSMVNNLVQWFLYSIVVSIIAAYIAGHALDPDADYLSVFRFAGCTAFACYTVAHWQDSIWFKRSWERTLRGTFDGLVYSLLTAGTFGWLWPI
ncbi:MAG: hypothetical protein ACKVRP_02275 [Bacteroidota bacterium]